MSDLSIIVPTFNEGGNLMPLLQCLERVLKDMDYEVVIVDDDSPDGTAAMARSIAQSNARVRVIQRIGRRGLASAAVEGMLATSSPYLLVMDADLQHDEQIIPAMLEKMKSENLDIVVGSRNLSGGGMGKFASNRVVLSTIGRRLSDAICKIPVTDPMSGFFLVTREHFHQVVHNLSNVGFKILVDLLASARRPVRLGEVAYTFRNREHGESKLDILVGIEYLQLLLDKVTHGIVPVSYLMFGMVGSIGVICNLVLAFLLVASFHVAFKEAQILGALITIAINFFLNNHVTFRFARLRGIRIVLELALFYVFCSVGLLAQVTLANSLQQVGMHWMAATLVGVLVGSVWNYSMAFLLVWHLKQRRSGRLQLAYAEPARFQEFLRYGEGRAATVPVGALRR
jgi:dolichol-phosphate mannosyltransferase